MAEASQAPTSPTRPNSPPEPKFPRFASLPPEIRHMIYAFTLPPENPELRILQPDELRSMADPPPSPPTVYTGYPILMHVSREARFFARSRIKLQRPPGAQCYVPYREFRAELDVLYVGRSAFLRLSRQPRLFRCEPLLRKLRHLAVDVVTTTRESLLVGAFRYLEGLETLHVVFGTTRGPLRAGAAVRLEPPVGRCALKLFDDGELRGVMVRGGPLTRPRSLEWYLGYVHGELREGIDLHLSLYDNLDIGVWDPERQTLKLRIVARVLVEYQRSEGDECWVEKGEDNILALT